jgi:hypothetical protein
MNVFDCHVNRAPVPGKDHAHRLHAGQVPQRRARQGQRGQRAQRNLDHRSEGRQRNIGVVQIAGLVARRIVSFIDENQSLDVGERFGLIRFGSRVDVYSAQRHAKSLWRKGKGRWPVKRFWPTLSARVVACVWRQGSDHATVKAFPARADQNTFAQSGDIAGHMFGPDRDPHGTGIAV